MPKYIRFEIFLAVIIKNTVVLDVTPCNIEEMPDVSGKLAVFGNHGSGVVLSSNTSVNFCRTARCYMSVDNFLQNKM